MLQNEKRTAIGGTMILFLVILNVIIIKEGFIRDESWYSALVITLPLLGWLHEHELVNSRKRAKAKT